MSTSVLETLRTQRDDLVGEIDGLMSGEFDPADPAITEARGRAEALDSKIKALVEWQASRNAANQLDAISIRHKQDHEDRQTREAESLSIGEAWVRSKAYTDYTNAPRGSSGRVTLPWLGRQERALIKTDSFAGLIQADRINPSAPPTAQTPFLDLISSVRVTSNAVEWVYYPSGAPLGTVTPEGTQKTEGAVTPTLKTVTLNTIASWAQYSRQFGEDAPGLVDYLNQSLGRGINDKRESLAAAELTGAGSGIPAITGGTDLLGAIRVGLAEVQNAGYGGGGLAVVLNPADWAEIDIALLGATLNGAVVGTNFWGVRPVAVSAVPAGSAYVGNFQVGMVELVRTDVSVYTTDSDILPDGSSAFRANVLTTIVEARTAPIVHRPEALVKVTPGAGAAAVAAAGKK